MTTKKELVLLFSGGVDSTYTAMLMAERYQKIHLITYDRVGFSNVGFSRNSALSLKEKYGEERLEHKIINIDELLKRVSYCYYLSDIFRYGLFSLSACGLCKLAMHWKTIIYCLENRIGFACDGANQEMRNDPSQNDTVLREIKNLYFDFGIEYSNPVFYLKRDERERALFNLGFTPVQKTKWTRFSFERQPMCSQEHLFLKFLNFMETDWKLEETPERKNACRNKMLSYLLHKMEFIKKDIYKSDLVKI